MKAKTLHAIASISGTIAFCMLISDPVGETPTRAWVLWEACWALLLIIDSKIISALEQTLRDPNVAEDCADDNADDD